VRNPAVVIAARTSKIPKFRPAALPSCLAIQNSAAPATTIPVIAAPIRTLHRRANTGLSCMRLRRWNSPKRADGGNILNYNGRSVTRSIQAQGGKGLKLEPDKTRRLNQATPSAQATVSKEPEKVLVKNHRTRRTWRDELHPLPHPWDRRLSSDVSAPAVSSAAQTPDYCAASSILMYESTIWSMSRFTVL
jgi:hypothetical protein